jgi:hypothetical protein
MAVAHSRMNIKQIPGLPLHPVQVAERQRLEELQKAQPQLALEMAANARGRDRLMSTKLKDALRKTAVALRSAGGLPEPGTDQGRAPDGGVRPGGASGSGAPATPAATPPGQRKADLGAIDENSALAPAGRR